MSRRLYLVHSNVGRARAFSSFASAVTFAERAYKAQAAGDLRAVPLRLILGGRRVGEFGPFGWKAGGLGVARKEGS